MKHLMATNATEKNKVGNTVPKKQDAETLVEEHFRQRKHYVQKMGQQSPRQSVPRTPVSGKSA